MPIQSPKRVATLKKYNAVVHRFNYLYNHPDSRKRLEDCYSIVASEFFLSEDSVLRILSLGITTQNHE